LLEWILIAAAVVAVVKTAKIEKKSRWLWGSLAFGLCLGSTSINYPYLPYLRVLIAAILTFVLMMACNISRKT